MRTETDRRGRIVDLAYDNRNRVTTETWKTTSTVSRTFNTTYDNLDRTTAIDDSDPFSTDFQFAYDAKSQLQSERQSPALVGTSVAFDRNYDVDGNETQLIGYFGATLSGQSFTGGIKDFINNYAYDGMNRVTSVTQATPSQGSALGVNTVAAKSAYFTYNAASQLVDMRRYNAFSPVTANLQVHSRYAYDNAGRLTSLTHGRTLIAGGESWNGTSSVPASLTPSTLLAAYSYSYDTANRITSMSSYRDAFKAAYTYDDTDQLTTVTNTAISGLTPPFTVPTGESYLLDANGNRKSSSGTSQSATGTQNRLQTDGTYNYTYDAEGNTTQRTFIATGAVTDYGYTYKNWLASVTERAIAGGAMTKRTEFVYDAFGQRVGKRVDSDGNGTWDRHEAYVWADGQEVLRLVDSDGDGTAQPFRVANRYLYAGAVDELLADEQFTSNSGPAVNATSGNATAGNTLYPLTDHLGSVRDLIDNNGINRQHVVYDSFGRRTLEVDYNASGTEVASNDPAAIDELFGYTGRDWDTDVGLQYNRARWYDPSTGRWMNQDPIGFAAGDANLYRYVGNEATGATDPSGLVGVEIASEDRQEFLRYLQNRPQVSHGTLNCVSPFPPGFDGPRAATPGELGALNLTGQIGLAVFGMLAEPIDWIMTAREIYNDPKNPLSYAGFIPLVPAGVGKALKHLPAPGSVENTVPIGNAAGGALTKLPAPSSGLRNPNSIRFSQDSIRNTFGDKRSIAELVDGLKSGKIKPGDLPAIRLVEREGHLISIDNRRLEACRQAGVQIKTRMATAQEILEAELQGKFSAGPLGSPTIRIRGN